MKKISESLAAFNRAGLIISIAVLLLVAAVFFILRAKKGEPIKIGAIISLSGAASNLVDLRDGMILAADEVNRRGGVNRRKIELIIEDSKTDPLEGEKAFNKIEAIHHPVLYVSALSSVSMALSHLAEKNEVVLVGLVVGNPALTEQKKWVFRYYSSAETEVPPIISTLRELKIKKLGVLYLNDAYGTSIISLLKEKFEKIGEIFKSEAFGSKESMFRDKIKILRDMEVIYVVGFPRHVRNAFVQLKEGNYKGLIFGPSGASSSSVRTAPAANGAYVAAPIIYNPNYLFAREAKEKYETRFDKPFNHQAANGYDFVKIVAGLFEDKEISRQNVRSLLEGGFTYPGVFGYIDVKPGQHDIVYPLHPARIVDGRLKYLR